MGIEQREFREIAAIRRQLRQPALVHALAHFRSGGLDGTGFIGNRDRPRNWRKLQSDVDPGRLLRDDIYVIKHGCAKLRRGYRENVVAGRREAQQSETAGRVGLAFMRGGQRRALDEHLRAWNNRAF